MMQLRMQIQSELEDIKKKEKDTDNCSSSDEHTTTSTVATVVGSSTIQLPWQASTQTIEVMRCYTAASI
jgi:hypothetical protein